mmetsp:Transcript_23355/g.28694  ORF Transcript_23355/g.28694 Transcript_23355/m.28694 type:complete len:103 (-) Transcript_23355:162-470(-)
MDQKEQEAKTKPDNDSENTSTASTNTAVVALLGHAVCKTSAEQMEDEIYSSGRKLAKSLQRIISPPSQTSASSTLSFLLEIQIELEPPEEKFDGWVTSWNDA